MNTAEQNWEHLRAAAHMVRDMFGAPARLLRALDWPAMKVLVLMQWVRTLEVWLRRLLVARAAGVTFPAAPERKGHPGGVASAPSFSCADEDDSAHWRVTFSLALARSAPRDAKPKRKAAPMPRAARMAALAQRLEALLRVVEAPERCVLRVARALAKRPELPRRALLARCAPEPDIVAHLDRARVALITAHPNVIPNTS